MSDYLFHWASASPAREVAVIDETRWTYADMAVRVRRQARALMVWGVRPGDRVAVLSAPRPEFFASVLAITAVGAVYLGLNPKSTETEMAYQVADSSPVAILWHFTDRAGQASKLGRSTGIPVLDGDRLQDEETADSHAALTAVSNVDDVAAVVYTSGTSGTPKGALLTHRGFITCTAVQNQRWLSSEGERTPLIEPVNHVSSVGDIAFAMLMAGGTVIYQAQFDPVTFIQSMQRERVTFWYSDPTVLLMCTRAPNWASADLSAVRRVVWSGGRAPLGVVRLLSDRVPLLGTSWGMTETVGSLTYTDDSADHTTLANSIGKPDPRFEVAVLDKAGAQVTTGDVGELKVRGDYIALGYLGNPKATSDAYDPAGWFSTGDLVRVWADGNLELVGRRSDMFKSGGENVYPREVEQVLESHHKVKAAVVFGIPHETWGEAGHAVVLSESDLDPDELRTLLRSKIARYKVPKSFEVVSTLPMLDNGKINRRLLISRAASRQSMSEPNSSIEERDH